MCIDWRDAFTHHDLRDPIRPRKFEKIVFLSEKIKANSNRWALDNITAQKFSKSNKMEISE